MAITMIGITPKVGLVFKKLFGVEENKDLLISLINSIVSEEDQVADVVILNPYNLPNSTDEKLSILDIKTKSVRGELYNIEMQVKDVKDYSKRALHHWAELYAKQLKKGDGYNKLNKAIGIHILNFISIPETEKYHNRFTMKNQDNESIFFKQIELHTIELSKFERNNTKQKLNEDEKIDLRWFPFLNNFFEKDKV